MMNKADQKAWLITQIERAERCYTGEYSFDDKGRVVFKLPDATCIYRVFPERLAKFKAAVAKSIAFKNPRGSVEYPGGKL